MSSLSQTLEELRVARQEGDNAEGPSYKSLVRTYEDQFWDILYTDVIYSGVDKKIASEAREHLLHIEGDRFPDTLCHEFRKRKDDRSDPIVIFQAKNPRLAGRLEALYISPDNIGRVYPFKMGKTPYYGVVTDGVRVTITDPELHRIKDISDIGEIYERDTDNEEYDMKQRVNRLETCEPDGKQYLVIVTDQYQIHVYDSQFSPMPFEDKSRFSSELNWPPFVMLVLSKNEDVLFGLRANGKDYIVLKTYRRAEGGHYLTVYDSDFQDVNSLKNISRKTLQVLSGAGPDGGDLIIGKNYEGQLTAFDGKFNQLGHVAIDTSPAEKSQEAASPR